MHTLGIDLAAEAKGTAVAQISWGPNKAELVHLALGCQDSNIIELSHESEKVGIDCALGWPLTFIEFLIKHASNDTNSKPSGDIDWRRDISFRETDRQVRAITGRWPLSVATDRLGMTALRCAGLQSKLSESGIPIDRSGYGKIVEIYPVASLRTWGFETSGYRVEQSIRADLLGRLEERAPWLNLGQYKDLLVSSADAFDSLVASLATRAVAKGEATLPSSDQMDIAKSEGWIALPTGTLNSLL